MIKKNYELAIIGGGPAGLAAAIEARKNGVNDIVIIERDERLGGILNQCIHNGFGLTRFKESLTGPEYAHRFIGEVESLGIETMLKTTVLSFDRDKKIVALSEELGQFEIEAKSIILAMGCRERSKGALNIPGSRPAGIYSAGTAQKYINIMGYMPGRRVIILGSGDIGLIMARRLTLEGAKVLAVCEIMPYSSGLKRNIAQCLDDFNIPLYLSHTITKIEGKDRVSGVTISKVDENKNPIEGSEIHFDCDTVLLSVGLIPENELTKNAGIQLNGRTKGANVDQDRETDIEGVFVCGNVLQVHDLVDFVSEEAEIAGRSAAKYILKGRDEKVYINTIQGEGVTYVCPQRINTNTSENVKIFFRVNGMYSNKNVVLESNGKVILSKKKKRLAPGEMENYIIPNKILKQLSGDITVKLED